MKKIVILCGGIGGAKLVKGFYNRPDFDLTVVVNTGDERSDLTAPMDDWL